MTIRQVLRSKLRNAIIVFLMGIILFIAGSLVEMTLFNNEVPVMVFIGMGCFVLAQLYIFLFIKCPKCGERLGVTILNTSSVFKFSMRINYCPICGVNFDSDFIGPT